MKKIYHLSTCDTCQRILKELQPLTDFELQDIKTKPLTEKQLDALYNITNSYEALFSKRARLYKSMELKDKNLAESDFKKLLLEHYTFLKRPVILVNNQVFVGNSKKEIAAALKHIHH